MEKFIKIVLGIMIAIIIISIGADIFFDTIKDTATITIEEKERINYNGSGYYLIFGVDENGNDVVFKNGDSVMYWKWNSSDIQSALKEGKTYEVTLAGVRIPFLSAYQNIIDYKEIS